MRYVFVKGAIAKIVGQFVTALICSQSKAVGCLSIAGDQLTFKFIQPRVISIVYLCLLLNTLLIVVSWPVVTQVNNWNVL